MSRPLRIQYEGAWYHVMNRGAAKKDIFHTNAHRELFLQLIDQIHQKFKIEIHAYCLMSNHYHLLVRTPLSNLDKCMRHLNGVYTQIFNLHQKTDGALFRGRYKAILVEDEEYLIKLSRYIHLNPVEANMCLNPEDYKWSSYQYYLRNKKTPSWLYRKNILKKLGEDGKQCNYRLFTLEGVDQEIRLFYGKKKTFPVLGSEKFLKIIKEKYLNNKSPEREIPESKVISKIFVPTIKQVIDEIAKYYEVDLYDIKTSCRGRMNMMKSIAIYIAVETCQTCLNKIGHEIGGLTRNGISNNYSRFLIRLQEDSNLKNDIDKIFDLLKMQVKMGNRAT